MSLTDIIAAHGYVTRAWEPDGQWSCLATVHCYGCKWQSAEPMFDGEHMRKAHAAHVAAEIERVYIVSSRAIPDGPPLIFGRDFYIDDKQATP